MQRIMVKINFQKFLKYHKQISFIFVKIHYIYIGDIRAQRVKYIVLEK